MPKIEMEIQRCADCPFFLNIKDETFWSNDGRVHWKSICKKINRRISDAYTLSDWCPLTMKPETLAKE